MLLIVQLEKKYYFAVLKKKQPSFGAIIGSVRESKSVPNCDGKGAKVKVLEARAVPLNSVDKMSDGG